jgi:hypothetical protein
MTTEILTELESVTKLVGAVRGASSVDAAEATIGAALATFDAKYADVMAPATLAVMRAEHEAHVRAEYDATLRTQAATLETRHAALVEGLSALAATLRSVPREANAQVDAMRELSAIARLQGRTRTEILHTYVSTTDAMNPTLVRLIEEDLAAFRPAADPDHDVEAVDGLQRAIQARREGRLPPALREALTRAEALLKPLNVAEVLGHLRSGRGVATAPRPDKRLHIVAS